MCHSLLKSTVTLILLIISSTAFSQQQESNEKLEVRWLFSSSFIFNTETQDIDAVLASIGAPRPRFYVVPALISLEIDKQKVSTQLGLGTGFVRNKENGNTANLATLYTQFQVKHQLFNRFHLGGNIAYEQRLLTISKSNGPTLLGPSVSSSLVQLNSSMLSIGPVAEIEFDGFNITVGYNFPLNSTSWKVLYDEAFSPINERGANQLFIQFTTDL
jgi:hypothetical protein